MNSIGTSLDNLINRCNWYRHSIGDAQPVWSEHQNVFVIRAIKEYIHLNRVIIEIHAKNLKSNLSNCIQEEISRVSRLDGIDPGYVNLVSDELMIQQSEILIKISIACNGILPV